MRAVMRRSALMLENALPKRRRWYTTSVYGSVTRFEMPLFMSSIDSTTLKPCTAQITPVGFTGYTTSIAGPRREAITFCANCRLCGVAASNCAKNGTECRICVFFAMMLRTDCPLNSGDERGQSKS